MTGLDDARREVREIADLEDPIARVKQASDLVAGLQEIVSEVSRIRREAVTELAAQGHSQVALAKMLGVARTRVQQLLTTGPQPERALLGSGALTVSIGGKWEAQKANPSAVISAEALAAYQVIFDLASGCNLTATYEVVPPPGMVRLNKDNLIVIGSPRILPIVSQTLEADQYLGFDSGAQGWYLRNYETGAVHRSPSDTGSPSDYAYIGRLPRPDGKGTFLYIAGIHAMGTLGAAHHIANNIESIYGKVKNRRWSALVECRYDPDSRQVEETVFISPIYTTA